MKVYQMHRWNNLLIEGERAHYMGDKPFDLVSVLVIDAQSAQLVFDNRFNKQQLLMDKYQTPIVEHLDAWVFIVCLANWLLYAAKRLFRTFDLTPFAPVKSNNGKGRAKGQNRTPRQRFKVKFKSKIKDNSFAKAG